MIYASKPFSIPIQHVLTSNPTDQLPPNAPFRCILEFQRDFAEVAEICTAFNDQRIALIVFGTKNVTKEVVVIPFINSAPDEIEVIMATEDNVYAMLVRNVGGRLQRWCYRK